MDHMRSRRQVQPGATGLQRQDEKRRSLLALELFHQLLLFAHRGQPVQDQSGTAKYIAQKVCQGDRDHSPYTKGNFEFERTVTGWRASHPALDLRLKR